LSVTATVDTEVPSAGSDEGLALVEAVFDVTTGVVNVTDVVLVKAIVSVVSVAEYTIDSAFVSVTLNVATPELSVVPAGAPPVGSGVMVELTPPAARLTLLPATGLWLEEVSRSVTVTVDASPPSAMTEDGLADTVEAEGDTAVIVGALPSPGASPSSVPSPGST
jgi:hypothetical protein